MSRRLGTFLPRQQQTGFLIPNQHQSGLDRFLIPNQHLSGLDRFLIPNQHLSGLDRFLIPNQHLSGLDRFLIPNQHLSGRSRLDRSSVDSCPVRPMIQSAKGCTINNTVHSFGFGSVLEIGVQEINAGFSREADAAVRSSRAMAMNSFRVF
jgi:hypothetical protein